VKQIHFGARSGFQIPRANIGAMRLPGNIDEAVALIRYAIDSGMRYIDTSRGYGDSEIKLGKALKDGYRQKVILSTKWAPWITKLEPTDDTSADCVRKRIDESMKRLDVEYLDYYQVWNIDSPEHYAQAIAKGGMLDGIRKAIDEKRVGHTGFTTHDTPENIARYVQEADWCEIILFTYNLLNRRYAPAIAAAHAKGIGTIIMNPVGGGKLGENSERFLAQASNVGARNVPDLAMRYILSNQNVTTIISGISKKSDVDAAIAAADAPAFSTDLMASIEAFLDGIAKGNDGFCTGCKYCLPCPQEINIPAVLSCIHDHRFLGFQKNARERYKQIKEAKADQCAQCGQCEPKCTQKLKIAEEMEYATKHLA
jgi:hypothetical protein